MSLPENQTQTSTGAHPFVFALISCRYHEIHRFFAAGRHLHRGPGRATEPSEK